MGTGEVRRGWMGSCSTGGARYAPAVAGNAWRAWWGAMPTWVDSHGRPNEDRKRAKTVSVLVRAMQGVLEERLKEHRRKAAPAAAWITEREERRGLIRHVFAAWAGTRGSHNVPDAHYSRDAWQEWRRRENPQQRKARRICEAVRRVASFAQCCFNKFWANRERNRRMLRLKLAVLRKVRAGNNWSRTRTEVSDGGQLTPP